MLQKGNSFLSLNETLLLLNFDDHLIILDATFWQSLNSFAHGVQSHLKF